MKLRQALVGVCFSTVFVAACSAPSEDTANSGERKADSSENALRRPETIEERREARLKLADRSAEDRDSKKIDDTISVQDDDAGHVGGEVPDEILEKIVKELMTKTDVTRADIEVIHAESLIWNDGSLGCRKPGQMYTQALVPGYRVILGHQGQQFDYRATEKGYFMLCDQPTLTAPGAGRNPPVR